jgi:hypothetical protein
MEKDLQAPAGKGNRQKAAEGVYQRNRRGKNGDILEPSFFTGVPAAFVFLLFHIIDTL